MAVDPPLHVSVPGAEPEELTAIVMAYQELWPKEKPPTMPEAASSWRFSGRWWVETKTPNQF